MDQGMRGLGPSAIPGTVNLDTYGNVYVGDHFLENWGNGRILEWDARRFPSLSLRLSWGFQQTGPFYRGQFLIEGMVFVAR